MAAERPLPSPWWSVATGVVAFVLRLVGLERPGVLVFDEIFYAPDAADLLRWGSEHGLPVHPFLGKALIGGGIGLFGFDPFGWRVASVVAGAIVVALTTATAGRLTRRVLPALLAGGLVAVDGLVHVTSRLALLDIFVALFTTLATYLLVRAWSAQPDRRVARRFVVAALAAVAASGLVKWSGLALLPAVLGVGWVLDGRLSAPGRPRRRARMALLGLVVGVPLAVLTIGIVPRALGPDRVSPSAWLSEQGRILTFHRELRPTNNNAAPAWTWAIQQHPARLFAERCAPKAPDPGPACAAGPDGRMVVVAGANPVVWLVGVAGLIIGLRRTYRGDRLRALLVSVVALQWLPWLLSPRASYSFYAVTLVPPMVLLAVAELSTWGSKARRRAGLAVGACALVVFVLLWPVWSGLPLAPDQVDLRMSWPGWSR